ncbi:MAG: hypothetical protein B7Z10_11880 [Rhodobacterales bacterium 32-66-7]|nr:MAG: hypothetical protein B7Z31_14185 [Rhodobacterales bacterium 12-65-15]OYX23135.1 MAG: hypothetical protein B7Z10_11880 [Rhodobacterales bacterium 32-66-7]
MKGLALALTLVAGPALGEPAPPAPGPMVARLEVGVFCALQAMDQMPAPGTISGWIHVVDRDIAFHWPDRQVVPAALGLAFGVKAALKPGASAPFAEMRIYKPGFATPEVWETAFSDLAPSLAFFRFDTPGELIPGLWRFEAWDGDIQLYTAEFEVVPAAALPDIAKACGAVS